MDVLQIINLIYKFTENTRVQARAATEVLTNSNTLENKESSAVQMTGTSSTRQWNTVDDWQYLDMEQPISRTRCKGDCPQSD